MSHSSAFETIVAVVEHLEPDELAELAGYLLDTADVIDDTFAIFFAELSELNQAELTSQCIQHHVGADPEE